MNSQKLSQTMKTRLTQIIYKYIDINDLNESTLSHLQHATFLLSRYGVAWLRQYKDDILLTISFHRGMVNDFPPNTYTKLLKSIEAL